MNNPFDSFTSILDTNTALFERTLGEPSVERLNDVRNAIAEKRLRVLVYGSYNAGKSTLVNALLGERRAPMGDIPTTLKEHTYEWDGHVLLDSPGVNAPAAHEAVAEDALARADLVLFLLSDEDQDAKDVYERLFRIIASGKKVFIIINPRTLEDAELAQVLDRLAGLLLSGAAAHGMDDATIAAVPRLVVHADAALRARENNQPVLLEWSGFNAFLAQFRAWLSGYDNDASRLDACKRLAHERLLKPALASVGVAAGDNATGDELDKILSELQTRERMLRVSARQQASILVNEERLAIRAVVESAAAGADYEQALAAIAARAGDKLAKWIAQQVSTTGGLALNVPTDPLRIDGLEAGGESDSSGSDAWRLLLTIDPTKIPTTLGIKWLDPVLRGMSTFLKRAQPVLAVLFTIFDTVRANQAAQAQAEAERRRALQIAQYTTTLADQLTNALADQAEQLLASLFAPDIAQAQQRVAEHHATLEGKAKDHEDLLAVAREIDALL